MGDCYVNFQKYVFPVSFLVHVRTSMVYSPGLKQDSRVESSFLSDMFPRFLFFFFADVPDIVGALHSLVHFKQKSSQHCPKLRC